MFIRDLIPLYDEPRPHYNTVATWVKFLEEKGYLKHTVYGNIKLFEPIISEREYRGATIRDIVVNLYDNSYTNVVSQFIEDEKMNLDELKDLIRRIENANK